METLGDELAQKGHAVRVRDLYESGFDPVLKAADFEELAQGRVSADIQPEQDELRWADQLILVFPIWWAGLPAILKGYIDRVFSYGFAYLYTEEGPKGLLNEKKVMIVNTTGASNEQYQQLGMHDSFSKTIDLGIFQFCGMEVNGHHYFGAVPMVSDEERHAMLVQVEQLVATI
jgi:NAD(P)H dehydrogenase (quinone)